MEVGGYPKPTFPCLPVPFDPTGPYVRALIHSFLCLQMICQAMDETVLTSEQHTIWVNSCLASLATHKLAGWDRLYYDFAIRQPALVHRGWACIMLYAEADGLTLLQDVCKFCCCPAPVCSRSLGTNVFGVGRDQQFDDHVNLIRTYVERLLIDHGVPCSIYPEPHFGTKLDWY